MLSKAIRIGAFAGAMFLFMGSTSSANAFFDLNAISIRSKVQAQAATSTLGGILDATSSVEAEVEADASLDLSAEAVREGERLDVSRDAETGGSESMSARAVLTAGDLRAYARTAIESDENLEGMSFENNRVEVRYRQEGKFLALVPISFTVMARAEADGDVSVTYPWYSFMTVDNEGEIETEMRVAVDNALKARTIGWVRAEGEPANPQFTAAESADIAANIHAVLSAHFEGIAE